MPDNCLIQFGFRQTAGVMRMDNTLMFRYLQLEPTMGVEPMTCRLRIGCSTSKLRWRSEEPDNSAGEPLRQMGPEGIALEENAGETAGTAGN